MHDHSIQTITKKRQAWLLGIAGALVYAVSYLGRLNYSAALPYLLSAGMLTKAQGGILSTAYFFAYGAGQMIHGAMADRTRPQSQILLGSLGAAAMNALFAPMAHHFPILLVIWTANGFFQSMIWAPTFLLVASSLTAHLREMPLWLLNTSPAIGAVVSYLFSGLLLLVFRWQSLFYGASVALVAGAAAFWALSRAAFRGSEKAHVPTAQPADKLHAQQHFLPLLMSSGAGILILPVMIHGMLKDGTTNWIPTYMNEAFSLSANLAVVLAIVPQAANLLAASVALWLQKHTHHEVEEICILFSMAAASLMGMLLFGRYSSIATILLFAVVTMSMQAVNVVFVSQMPTHFAHSGKMATVSGFFNSVAYIGCAIATYAIGILSERCGWSLTILVWLVSACISLVLALCAVRRWKAFRKEQKD